MTSPDLLLRADRTGKVRREEVEREQIRKYGARYAEYRRLYKAAGRLEYEPSFPLYLMLEQTYHCNLRCPVCIQGLPQQRKSFEPGVARMPRELFEHILLEGERHGCPSVSMHVNDEPLLVKDLPERIAFAKAHGFMDLIMTTNGLLFSEEKVQRVIDAGVTHILFSIDAVTKETYDKVRLGGNYDKVFQAIETVCRVRSVRNAVLPLVRASLVQNKLNEHETEAFREKFSSLVDYVEIQGFTAYYGHTDHLAPTGADRVDDFTCNEPWRKLIVRANGDVLPCCSFYGYEIVLGNVRDSSLFDLFNSARMKRMRKDFKRRIYVDPACKTCSKSFYMPKVDATK